ncbi:MAG TPA: protein kinase [Pyrinomonadaceae bacterium]
MKKRLRLLSVGLYFALMAACAVAGAYLTFGEQRWAQPQARGWFLTRPENGLRVNAVAPGGPAAALKVGDEVVALGGRPLADRAQFFEFFRRLPRESDYQITVRRDGREETFTLRTVGLPLSWWAVRILFSVVIPALFLSTGVALFVLKPFDKQALLLALYFGTLVTGFPGLQPQWWLTALLLTGFVINNALSFPLLLHFSLNFPERSPLLRRYPRLEWLVYLLFLPVSIAHLVPSVLNIATPLRLPRIFYVILFSLYLIAGLLLFVAGYRHLDQTGKRKVRLLLFASVAAGLPYLAVETLVEINSRVPLGFTTSQWDWLHFLRVAGCLLVPPAWAYAILRHRVIPVSVVVRRGVQYLLAKNALRVLLLLPVAGLAASVVANRDRSLSDLLLRNSFYFYLLLLAAVVLGLVFRRRLADWIDRRFFRESYDREKILRALVEDVKTLDSIPEMSRRVADEVERALHPVSLYLFYREKEHSDLSLSYTSGGSTQHLRVPEDFQLLRFIELQGRAQDFPFPRKNNLPQQEKDWLASLCARLIVPLTGTDGRLSGLFILGDKKSEVPYTARDRELLEAVASQIAVIHENLRLRDRVREDRQIRRDVLSRFEGQAINLLKECPRCGRCFDSSAQQCDRDGAELQLSLPVERTVEGRYRLERLLGKGGMGAVYEATHLKLGHRVAVKILGGQMFGDPAALRRFGREARALARLSQHENIVAVHDYGELQTGGAFLVMDLIEGETLGALLRRERHVTPARAAEIFGQVFEGLKAAHAAGVIHRDLKPDNVFLSAAHRGGAAAPHVRLLDFGLAKLAVGDNADSQAPTAGRDPITAPGAVMGTFGYMSPEQLTGGRVDERSDLFSAGVMLCEALTGERPFKGATLHELITSVLNGDFRLTNGGGDPRVARLDSALSKCLARDPAARFSSAAEAQTAIAAALRDCPPHAFQPAEAETAILER